MGIKTTATITEGEPLWLLARPQGPSGDTITRSYVSAASLKVFDPRSATPNTPVATKVLAVAADPGTGDNCLFDAVQTDGMWDGDGGYTFAYGLFPATYDMQGGNVYRVEVELTVDLLSGQTWPIMDDYGTWSGTWIVTVKGRAST